MIRHRALGLAAGLGLLASLLAGPFTVFAQGSTDLTQSYTWEAHGVTVQYPANWVAAPTGNVVSVHPADLDVSDGHGPEVVLFALPGASADQLDDTARTYASSVNGRTGTINTGTVDGYPSRSFTFAQASPSASGGVTLVALDDGSTVGIAYIVRSSQASAYLPVLQAISRSVTFSVESVTPGTVTPTPAIQEPTARAVQTYAESTYGYAIEYPLDWVMEPGTTPGELTLHPADADLSAGNGPEFVVLVLDSPPSSDIDEVLGLIIDNRPGTFSPPESGQIDGYETRLVTYTDPERDPAQSGGITLIQLDADTFLAVGYRAPEADFETYAPDFETIRQSIHFPGDTAASQTVTTGISQSVASVQLEQRFAWTEGGVTLSLPAGWQISADEDRDGAILTATPPLDLQTGANSFQIIQGATFSLYPGENLPDVAAELASDFSDDITTTDVTIAGYPAVLYDVIDDTDTPVLHLRAVVIDLQDGTTGLYLHIGSDLDQWDSFRPVADAVIASVERLDDDLSRFFSRSTSTTTHPLRADAYWIGPGTPVPGRQTGETRPFTWEEYGITATLPEGWTGVQGGEDFDLAFASPEAQSTGEGAFITMSYFSTLGPGITLDAALADVADQVGGEVEPYAAGATEGFAVNFTDADAGTIHHLILASYGDIGESLYIQTSAPDGGDDPVQAILDSLTFDPPLPDYALIDAAWQQSLADSERLIYGDPGAPVWMLEILEMGCVHCANYTLDVNRLMALEVEPGQLQIELTPMVFNGNEATSGLATQAIYCATEQGKGYTAYEALYASYRDLSAPVAYTRDQITATLGSEAVSVDVEALNQCLDAGTYEALLGTNNTRATDYGVTGTPGVLFATGDEDFQFLELPDGSTWTGGIPIEVVRIVIEQVNNGAALSDMFVSVSPTATEQPTDGSPSATPEATDAATSIESSGAGSTSRDVLVSAAQQATEEAGEPVIVEPSTTEEAAAPAAGTGSSNEESAASTDEEDDNTATVAVVVGGVLLLALAGIGFVMVSRRQAAPPSHPSGTGTSDEDDTLDVSNDDTL